MIAMNCLDESLRRCVCHLPSSGQPGLQLHWLRCPGGLSNLAGKSFLVGLVVTSLHRTSPAETFAMTAPNDEGGVEANSDICIAARGGVQASAGHGAAL